MRKMAMIESVNNISYAKRINVPESFQNTTTHTHKYFFYLKGVYYIFINAFCK